MTNEQPETREQEVARIRSYLASQSQKRTPAQIVDAVREAHHQFLQATNAIPDAIFSTPLHTGEWAAIDILEHVCAVADLEDRAIRTVIEHGQRPADIREVPIVAPHTIPREQLLSTLEATRERLFASVLQADPQAHLDITWGHDEFGPMNWREWLLFARVHTLDHTRQMQAVAATLTPPQEGKPS